LTRRLKLSPAIAKLASKASDPAEASVDLDQQGCAAAIC
jgi:hypothetical protein